MRLKPAVGNLTDQEKIETYNKQGYDQCRYLQGKAVNPVPMILLLPVK